MTIFTDLINKCKMPKSYGIENMNRDFNGYMNLDIIVEKRVRVKYQQGWINKIRDVEPTEFVVHGTAGGNSIDGIIQWMLSGERAVDYLGGVGLFHYLIGRGEKGEEDGKIVEIIDPSYWVYSATSGKFSKYQIAVELINSSKSNRDAYTKMQYMLVLKLWLDYLRPMYPSLNKIVGHRWCIWKYNSQSAVVKYDKLCPGAGFDWNVVKGELNSRGLNFKDIGSSGKEGFEII